MNMRVTGSYPAGLTSPVDKRIGDAFPIIEAVYRELERLKYIANNAQEITPKQIQLRSNDVLRAIEWRYEDAEWQTLCTFVDLTGVDIASIEDTLESIIQEAELKINDKLNQASEIVQGAEGALAIAEGIQNELTTPSGNEPVGGFISYDALESYSGEAVITKLISPQIFGDIYVDDSAPVFEVPNRGTSWRDSRGRLWRRVYDQGSVEVNWFPSADPTGNNDSFLAIQAAIDACPVGGRVIFCGMYRSSLGLHVGKIMSLVGIDQRLANVSNYPDSKSIIVMGPGVSTAISVDSAILTVSAIVLVSPYMVGTGIKSYGPNNNIILNSGSVIEGFDYGIKISESYYSKFDNATITFCNNAIDADYCYNIAASALTIRVEKKGLILRGNSRMTMHSGSIENFTEIGADLSNGSGVSFFGTYFEGNGGIDVSIGYNCAVNAIGCHVYASTGTISFIRAEAGVTGTRVFSRNNQFSWPTDSRNYTAYTAPTDVNSAFWDVAGDNWDVGVGANTIYCTANLFALEGDFRFDYPSNHPEANKNINTTPDCLSLARVAFVGTPKDGSEVVWANADFSGDDPLNLRVTSWGYKPYRAIFQNGRWEKVGLRLTAQSDSTASDVTALRQDFNALLANLRNNGVM